MAKRGRPPDVGRRRQAAELRARGLSLAEVGRRLGISKQAAHQLLRGAGAPGPGPVRCAACGAAVGRPALRTRRTPPALCPACLAKRPGAPFGLRLLAHRLAAGLSRSELEERAGVARKLIARYEGGGVRPRAETLARLAGVLGSGLFAAGGGRGERGRPGGAPQPPSAAYPGSTQP
jgi:transcriptional regulator with XRE-family HTH domain